MIKFFKDLFKKTTTKIIPPHVCEYKCTGYCPHFGAPYIQQGIDNPDWYHFPSSEVLREWLEKGFDVSPTFQSIWKCSCGKSLSYFFLANPYKKETYTRDQYDSVFGSISCKCYDEMIQTDPIRQGASRGISAKEMTDELVKEFC
ncbi:MAG: hypothetical protein K8R85_08645 [Bacteroidetes bacterium]|nr:hypothetical protein [Bacteroidota bacterium]